jgi:cytochrome P450
MYDLIARRKLSDVNGRDLLGQLLQTAGFDDDLIRDQLLTMFIAGHDTSTAHLAWTLYLLGSHPNALAQVRAEVDAVLAGDLPAAEHMNKLPFMDAVLKESLRLYPPIHLGNRFTNQDVQMCGYDLPADSRVMYSIYLAHRHPSYWQNPADFQPERFLHRQSGERPSLTYVPFGGGPRNCIGAVFAQIEAKVVLARILQQFDLKLEPDKVKAHMGATLEPRPGVFMTVQRRGKRND